NGTRSAGVVSRISFGEAPGASTAFARRGVGSDAGRSRPDRSRHRLTGPAYARRMPADSIRSTLERALDAYDALADLGGSIDDEWSYVNDLSEAWRERLEVLVDARGDDAAAPDVSAAVDRAIDEVGLITDPH